MRGRILPAFNRHGVHDHNHIEAPRSHKSTAAPREKDTRMTEQTVNIPLLRKAVEWAEAEAAKPIELCEWEQGEYVAGPEEFAYWRDYHHGEATDETVTGRLALKASDCGTCYCIAGYVSEVLGADDVLPPSDEWSPITFRAADLLGLTYEQRANLFYDHNTIADVRRIAEDIAGERL